MKKTTFLKRLLTMLTAFVMAVAMIPVGTIEAGAYSAAKPLPDISELSQVEAFISVAESQYMYQEKSSKDTVYGNYFSANYSNWCTTFVSWCAEKANIPNNIIPRRTRTSGTSSANSFYFWYNKQNGWHDSAFDGGTYNPQRGDLILFSYSYDRGYTYNGIKDGPSHIGIVTDVSNGIVTYINGNTSYDLSTNKNYSLNIVGYGQKALNSKDIRGYCHPNWSDDIHTATPQKPTITIYQKSNRYTGKYICITSPTSGATIYYTTDGTTPNKNSKSLKNGGSIYVNATSTIKAVAYLNGKYSSVASKKAIYGMYFGDVNGDGSISLTDVSVLNNYINSSTKPKICIYNADVNGDGKVTLTDMSQINQYVLGSLMTFTVKSSPTITAKQSGSSTKVTISAKPTKAEIFYSVNGKTATRGDNKITNGSTVTINQNCTINVSVFLYGVRVSTGTKSIEVSAAKPSVPNVYVYQANDVYSSKYVMLSSQTSGSKIYYTTDGTNPTTSSKCISNGKYIVLDGSGTVTLKAAAYKDGAFSSVVTKSIYPKMKFGDANGDGKINNNDVEQISDYICGLTAYICRYNVDVDGDREISITDLSQVQKYISGELELFTLKDYPEVSIEYLEGSTKITVWTNTQETLYYSTDGGASYNTMNSGDIITLYSTSKFRVYGSIYGEKSYTYATTVKVEPKKAAEQTQVSVCCRVGLEEYKIEGESSWVSVSSRSQNVNSIDVGENEGVRLWYEISVSNASQVADMESAVLHIYIPEQAYNVSIHGDYLGNTMVDGENYMVYQCYIGTPVDVGNSYYLGALFSMDEGTTAKVYTEIYSAEFYDGNYYYEINNSIGEFNDLTSDSTTSVEIYSSFNWLYDLEVYQPSYSQAVLY